MSEDMFIDEERLSNRLEEVRKNEKPLRLLFSGRLNEMKGAMDIVLVAHELKKRGLNFQFDICGGGVLEESMRQYIGDHDLEDCVQLRGILDFATELVPKICDSTDLFVCCHKQGDPSCTYLETFACGVPIAGYLNEAFEGISERVDAGWGVKMNDVIGMATTIERLSKHRDEIATKSVNALTFSRQHTFESTFERRMQFFRKCVATDVSGL
ncbi:MAG: glycosyltransferase [Rubripirellula sp.]